MTRSSPSEVAAVAVPVIEERWDESCYRHTVVMTAPVDEMLAILDAFHER